jgi:hypothetical protein
MRPRRSRAFGGFSFFPIRQLKTGRIAVFD